MKVRRSPSSQAVSTGLGAAACWSSLSQFSHGHHQKRFETTGKHHTFEPGRFAKTSRAIFKTFTSEGMKKAAATKLQAGLEKVERMEKEQQWLRKHGSPQRVLDLPEHATYYEIKSRYQDLILDTHPDTARHKQSYQESVKQIASRNQNAAMLRGKPNSVMPIVEAQPATFEEIRQAHAILTDPNSLYHVNGTNNELLTEVRYFTGKEDASLTTPATKLAIVSWVIFTVGGIIVTTIAVKLFLEKSLEIVDPDFYKKMMAKEKDEAERREAGEFVNTDPERVKPEAVLKVLRPGLFLHGTPQAENSSDYDDSGEGDDEARRRAADWRESKVSSNAFTATNVFGLHYWNAFFRALKGN